MSLSLTVVSSELTRSDCSELIGFFPTELSQAYDLFQALRSSRGTLPCVDRFLPGDALSPDFALVLHGDSASGKSLLLRNILAAGGRGGEWGGGGGVRCVFFFFFFFAEVFLHFVSLNPPTP